MRRSFLKLAGMAMAVTALAGCAASGARYDQVASSMPSLKAGEGRVYFFRASSMVGAAVQPDIRLDGAVVGESKPGGFFYVDRPAGSHVASSATETEKVVTFVLEPGESKFVRSSISMGLVVGRVVLELEAPEKARTELASLAYTGK